MSKQVMTLMLSVALAAFALGCDKSTGDGGEGATAQTAAAGGQGDTSGETSVAASEEDVVSVPKEGKKFEPELESAEKLPEGAWYCDMGTVHYARMEKGDGTCPVCHMKLTQKTGESTGGAHHEHGEGEHHHGEGEHHMEHGE